MEETVEIKFDVPFKFDMFLPCAPKDHIKLPYVIQSVVDNIPGHDNIIILTPSEIPFEVQDRIPAMYYVFMDVNALPGINPSGWKYRPNWSFQQHAKLFQRITKDWYLTLDCDTIINRRLEMFEGGKPVCWHGWEQNTEEYFRFQEEMIGVGRVANFTFIADMNLFYRPIINEMLERNNYTMRSFCEKSQQIISKDCWIGEPELYGNYCYKYHPDLYVYKQLKQADLEARVQYNKDDVVWTDSEIRKVIRRSGVKDVDTFSFHSWFMESGM